MANQTTGRDEASASSFELAVWALTAVAVMATLYFLMHEPEEGVMAELTRGMGQARALAMVTAGLGSVIGVWHILARGGGRNLFAMAVLFSIILECFWLLRLILHG